MSAVLVRPFLIRCENELFWRRVLLTEVRENTWNLLTRGGDGKPEWVPGHKVAEIHSDDGFGNLREKE